VIFLIEYDKPRGAIVRFEPFDDTRQTEAESLRLAIELDLREKRISHEVVLLEALSEEDLRKTHRRYFENVNEIGKAIPGDAA
jgi:hypothetical protein